MITATISPTRPDLTDPEIDALCSGLRQNAAKVRYLQGLGLVVNTRPNGRPLVWRAHAEQVLSGTQQPPGHTRNPEHSSPACDRGALLQLFRTPRAA